MEEIASSVAFGALANWSGSSVFGEAGLMLCMTSLSKHFIMIGVRLWTVSLDDTVIFLVPV